MYTTTNFRTKRELTEAFEKGEAVFIYQPSASVTGFQVLGAGKKAVYLEGPHYPEPHKWYAQGIAYGDQLCSLKGSKAFWAVINGELKFTPSPTPKVFKPRTSKAPSIATMYKWMSDGVARSTDGCRCEPDGYCEHGCPSWIIKLGAI